MSPKKKEEPKPEEPTEAVEETKTEEPTEAPAVEVEPAEPENSEPVEAAPAEAPGLLDQFEVTPESGYRRKA
jgi:hypothetical protein